MDANTIVRDVYATCRGSNGPLIPVCKEEYSNLNTALKLCCKEQEAVRVG